MYFCYYTGQPWPWCNAVGEGTTTWQTRYIDLMLGQCWADVGDGGPALAQLGSMYLVCCRYTSSLVTYSLILTISFFIAMHHCLHQDFEPVLVRCNVGPASQAVYQHHSNTGSPSYPSHSSWTTRAHFFFLGLSYYIIIIISDADST